MDKQRRFSRWRRLPGVHRITDQRLPDHRAELQRLSLYLTGALLDDAEMLAARSGMPTVQQYCEQLLGGALRAETARTRVEPVEIARELQDGLDAIASDPDFLAEWTGAQPGPGGGRPLTVVIPGPQAPPPATPRLEQGPGPAPGLVEVLLDQLAGEPADQPVSLQTDSPATDPDAPAAPDPKTASDPVAVVLQHADLDPGSDAGLIRRLRRGEPVTPAQAEQLLRALMALEARFATALDLPRRLVFGLHRIAFEGQVLLTDAWPHLQTDQATVDLLRLAQESVDRILSGQDIHYDLTGPPPEPLR